MIVGTYLFTLLNNYFLFQELGVDDILQKIEDLHGGLVSDACKKTVTILVKNSVEILENHIMDILEDLSGQMSPKITSFLLESQPTDRSSNQIIAISGCEFDIFEILSSSRQFFPSAFISLA